MVDWASQDRLYPSGYQQIDIRYPIKRVNSSLPYSTSPTRIHSCRSKTTKTENEEIQMNNYSHRIDQLVDFFNETNDYTKRSRIPKLLASYISNINWPRSVCCLTEGDGSLIVCEQDRCRLLLFSSHLMLRSTCGGNRGEGEYEFNSPWSVASLFDQTKNEILVADTNNQRIQLFHIEEDDYQFRYKLTLMIKEKPFYISTSKQHFAVSCQNGLISTFLANNKTHLTNININRILNRKKLNRNAFYLCMDTENSSLFVSEPFASVNLIYQLTINGEYVRSIRLDNQKVFIQISSLGYDSQNGQIIVGDSLNSIIYSVEHDYDEQNVEILLKRSDQLNYPQSLCVTNQGHLVVVECSLLTQHALKIFRHHPCICHSRLVTSSLKTSEKTSVRSLIFQY